MAPSLTGWLIEKELYLEFRWRTREVLEAAPVEYLESDVIADLCLRRLLTLQREARRAALFRQREALAALTRSAVEAAIIGCYSAFTDDPTWADRVGKKGLRYFAKSAGRWTPDAKALESIIATLTVAEVREMPDVAWIAQQVDGLVTFDGQAVAGMLYAEYFVPLSNASVHTTLLSLGRYHSVGSHRRRRRPYGVVPRRGLVRTVDASAALLAASIAHQSGHNPGWYVAYGVDQLRRANRPVPIMLLRMAFGGLVGFAGHVPQLLRLVRDAKGISKSTAFQTADDDQRADMLLHLLAEAGIDRDFAAVLVRSIVDSWPSEPSRGGLGGQALRR